LSARDRAEFDSLFVSLGIAERIEYGTFNKLCESLLNEECNVRERVKQMVLSNAASTDAIESSDSSKTSTTSTKAVNQSNKVLLIDEVDVFLSEKYYGGLYTPSLVIIDNAIKYLLDAIWQYIALLLNYFFLILHFFNF
jgi:hypothetical protein